MDSATLKQIVALAQARRVARLGYKPAGAAGAASEYLVEPYRLHRTPAGLALHAWQLSPAPEGRSGWRDFRLDRITSVADAGRTFETRVPVTVPADAGHGDDHAPGAAAGTTPAGPARAAAPTPFAQWSDRPIGDISPAERYYQQLETAMLDGQITDEELALAEEVGRRVDPHERKAVHARIFASVLHEVLQDGKVLHREELYLQQVRRFLDRLGWAP